MYNSDEVAMGCADGTLRISAYPQRTRLHCPIAPTRAAAKAAPTSLAGARSQHMTVGWGRHTVKKELPPFDLDQRELHQAPLLLST
jgi:hypothetical protein